MKSPLANATKTLGCLRRNLAFALRQTKDAAYKTLVRPKLEYAAHIWHPHAKTQITQLEMCRGRLPDGLLEVAKYK